jgi:hypothetical protein
MNLATVHPGDLVECCKLGRTFPARVEAFPGRQVVDVAPCVRNVSYRRLRAREIRRVIERAARSAQLQLGDT